MTDPGDIKVALIDLEGAARDTLYLIHAAALAVEAGAQRGLDDAECTALLALLRSALRRARDLNQEWEAALALTRG